MNEFDLKALTWDSNPMFIKRSKRISERIIAKIPLNIEMEAIEFGCGTGLISFNLIPFIKSITLADNSEGMLNVLNKKIKDYNIQNMEVIKTDLLEESLINNKYDLIYTVLALHHIEDVDNVLSKFYNMQKENSYLCIADLDEEDGNFHGENFAGHKGFSRIDLQNKLEIAGYKNIDVETCYEIKRKSEQGIENTYPVFLMTAEK
ncbi:MAG: class I SAM-dependent methyltransferase [Bacteroidales bacterium]|nr:class I SAM-dependent methyltransferase [Bacteroidales bacterium]